MVANFSVAFIESNTTLRILPLETLILTSAFETQLLSISSKPLIRAKIVPPRCFISPYLPP